MRSSFFVASFVLLASFAGPAVAEEPTLIPRETLFGNPDRAGVRLSPDGKHLSYLSDLEGVMNLWVAPRDDLSAAKAVTADTGRGIRSYFWAYDNRHLLYLQDEGGNENWHLYALDLESGETLDLTPIEGIAARVERVSPDHPGKIVVALNDRVPMFHDLYVVDLDTGERELLEQNTGYLGYVVDDDYQVRFAARMAPGGAIATFRRTEEGTFEPFLEVGPEDSLTTQIIDFDGSGEKVYALDSRGRDTAALVLMDLDTKETEVLHEDPRADVGDLLVHPTDHTAQAVSVTYDREAWTVLDDRIAEDLRRLHEIDDGDLHVTSRTLDDRWWTVAFLHDDAPLSYHLYDREAGTTKFLFHARKALADLPLVEMHPVVIRARDGLDMVGYLSLPQGTALPEGGQASRAHPMVLLVHGGPWARDDWGYNPRHQWLANRGYAALSLNFRGSTGFGKEFLNAANREWAGKMHTDLLDAVDWAVARGVTARDQVAIMGGSYGGYATLVGLTMTPEVFACGVDVVGPSSLITLLESIPPYWAPMIEMFTVRVGDHRTEEGRAFLEERSPLSHVDEIRRPLLIGQGANDPRVKVQEAEQIVEAMRERDIPVTYVVYPDEGHGFQRPENSLSFNAVTEAFLAEHLGGRVEPIGNALDGSSIEVPVGAAGVPGLEAALAGEVPVEPVAEASEEMPAPRRTRGLRRRSPCCCPCRPRPALWPRGLGPPVVRR